MLMHKNFVFDMQDLFLEMQSHTMYAYFVGNVSNNRGMISQGGRKLGTN